MLFVLSAISSCMRTSNCRASRCRLVAPPQQFSFQQFSFLLLDFSQPASQPACQPCLVACSESYTLDSSSWCTLPCCDQDSWRAFHDSFVCIGTDKLDWIKKRVLLSADNQMPTLAVCILVLLTDCTPVTDRGLSLPASQPARMHMRSVVLHAGWLQRPRNRRSSRIWSGWQLPLWNTSSRTISLRRSCITARFRDGSQHASIRRFNPCIWPVLLCIWQPRLWAAGEQCWNIVMYHIFKVENGC